MDIVVQFIKFIVLFVCLAAAGWICNRTLIIPDKITWTGTGAGIVTSLFGTDLDIADALVGLLAGGGTVFLIAWFYVLVKKEEGIGGGCIKLQAMVGAFIGWKGALISFVVSLLSLAVFCYIPHSIKNRANKYGSSFGEHQALGALIYLIFNHHEWIFDGFRLWIRWISNYIQ